MLPGLVKCKIAIADGKFEAEARAERIILESRNWIVFNLIPDDGVIFHRTIANS